MIALLKALWVLYQDYRKTRHCQHLRVRENRECDVICADCGRNLGFIATWRKLNETTGARLIGFYEDHACTTDFTNYKDPR